MSDTQRPATPPLGLALGKVPSGLYILTARHEGRATGMLASWVMQAGFNPPAVSVAIGVGRFVADWVASSGKFTLNQVPAGGKSFLKHFGRGFGPDDEAFEGLTLLDVDAAGPVIGGALGYLDVEVVGETKSGDHRIFVGNVVRGGVLEAAAEPFVHVRTNGMHY